MTTLTKIIVATLMSLTLFSCNFDMHFNPGVKGNGNVQTEVRIINESFNSIHVSRGLDVYLTQSNTQSIKVEADENLHDIIVVEVENGELKITTTENIAHSKAQKVMVSFSDVSKITSTSGSDVYSTNVISVDNLRLKTTSGSDMELEVDTNTLECKSTSGSDLRLSGKTKNLIAEATSGSDIKAGKLMAESSQVEVTSGADITINTSQELNAKASSGGDITYYGNPEIVKKSDGVSGSIRKR
ncbi:head GIN domain-containing protein [Yeosuana sp. MJ-SS3]|uniref:Head GIN domain-containing protein n=1 Tax=Gilvirhabdus luticola TaxID=3079858 RepID=A0ABU3U7Y7_9FLAO|nr:head GIN domain-containing protein [Yeosuana sp. MJ-SS3]MDU8886524.1 head GIN domain-containing protein [Yeosuana sp. MJ-SS3]